MIFKFPSVHKAAAKKKLRKVKKLLAEVSGLLANDEVQRFPGLNAKAGTPDFPNPHILQAMATGELVRDVGRLLDSFESEISGSTDGPTGPTGPSGATGPSGSHLKLPELAYGYTMGSGLAPDSDDICAIAPAPDGVVDPPPMTWCGLVISMSENIGFRSHFGSPIDSVCEKTVPRTTGAWARTTCARCLAKRNTSQVSLSARSSTSSYRSKI